MNYDDLYLLARIKKLEYELSLVSSRLGSIVNSLTVSIISGSAPDSGATDPIAAPANPALPKLYLNTTTNVLFVWNPVTASWDI